MNIGYSKLGRRWNIDMNKISVASGEDAVIIVLKKLATYFPQHSFYILGSIAEDATAERLLELGYPSNVHFKALAIDQLDRWVAWTGTNRNNEDHTSLLLDMMNAWQYQNKEVIWLSGDAKTDVDYGDALKIYPTQPVLSQYDAVKTTSNGKTVNYSYAALEFETLELPSDKTNYSSHFERSPFGLIMNEASKETIPHLSRKHILKEYVLDTGIDYELYGKWSTESSEELGIKPVILPFSPENVNKKNQAWLATITTPPSGDTKFVSPKPWEAFAAKTVCFFHPSYDTDNHVFNGLSKQERNFLRVTSPRDFAEKLDTLIFDEPYWFWLTEALHLHYITKYKQSNGGIAEIVNRLK